MALAGNVVPAHRHRAPLLLDIHRAVCRLVVERGPVATAKLLRIGSTTLEEVRTPRAVLRPATIDRLRERLVELGELVA